MASDHRCYKSTIQTAIQLFCVRSWNYVTSISSLVPWPNASIRFTYVRVRLDPEYFDLKLGPKININCLYQTIVP